MSNLQIGLAIAGGIVLAAVVAHGAWSARKAAPRQPQPDLAAGETTCLEPALAEVSNSDAGNTTWPGFLPRRAGLDALIDVIAPIVLDGTHAVVSGEAALAAMPATRRAGSKPFAIEGMNANTQTWETPQPGQRYSGFQAGVQLANRSGALNEIEFSEFVVKTQAFADAWVATADFPDMLDAVARARELDQFASAHDAQLGFTIRACHASWSTGFVQQHAARLGFVPGALPGRMVLPAATDGAAALLVLSFDAQAALAEDSTQAAVRDVALHLDVAQVDRAEQPFERMRHAAQALATAMDGLVTDDNGRSLTPEVMDAIGAELGGLYDALEQRDLAAGSLLARRLFS